MKTEQKPKSLVDQFYAHPTPAGAVALARADHMAANQFPMWEFVGELRTAEKRLAAFDELVDVLRYLVGDASVPHSQATPEHIEKTIHANKNALELLARLRADAVIPERQS